MSEPLPFAGRLKRWKHERGFGFIERDDRRDVFLHATTAKASGLDGLEIGARVRFDCAVDTIGRLRATRIALEAPCPAATSNDPVA
jgi:cold shock CspA family protein